MLSTTMYTMPFKEIQEIKCLPFGTKKVHIFLRNIIARELPFGNNQTSTMNNTSIDYVLWASFLTRRECPRYKMSTVYMWGENLVIEIFFVTKGQTRLETSFHKDQFNWKNNIIIINMSVF